MGSRIEGGVEWHYITSDNRRAQTLAGVRKKAGTHSCVTTEERAQNEVPHQYKADEAQRRHDPPRLDLTKTMHRRHWECGSVIGKAFLEHSQTWSHGTEFAVEMTSVMKVGRCADLHLDFVCFRWPEIINITPSASCVWAAGWRSKIGILMP